MFSPHPSTGVVSSCPSTGVISSAELIEDVRDEGADHPDRILHPTARTRSVDNEDSPWSAGGHTHKAAAQCSRRGVALTGPAHRIFKTVDSRAEQRLGRFGSDIAGCESRSTGRENEASPLLAGGDNRLLDRLDLVGDEEEPRFDAVVGEQPSRKRESSIEGVILSWSSVR